MYPSWYTYFFYWFQVIITNALCANIKIFSLNYLFELDANYNIVVVFAMHSHESVMGVHVSPSWTPLPPPTSLPSHPSGSSQCTSPEHPVSCIESGLAIYFTYGKYTCFNAILSDHPTLAFSQRVQNSVLYICVSFSVLHIGISLPSF